MEHSFWHERWESGRIGFHQGKPNKLLLAHFDALGLADRSRVFLPLCGKTRDIAWLLSQGYRVAGAELSELAIRQLFEELGVEPVISNLGQFKRYSATDIEIFVGDIFSLTAELLGPVDAVFDRAALVPCLKRCAQPMRTISSIWPRPHRSFLSASNMTSACKAVHHSRSAGMRCANAILASTRSANWHAKTWRMA
jgi:hypothetical protein